MVIKVLNDFISSAQKSRKYLPNTATNFRTPLRLIESELTEDEKNSIELVKKNLDQIFSTLYTKYGSRFSASSIEVYKRRIRNLIADYEKHGKNPTEMVNWDRPIVRRKLKTENKGTETSGRAEESGSLPPLGQEASSTKHEELLSSGKAIILTPPLNSDDIAILRAYIDYLEKKLPKKDNPKTESNKGGSHS